MTSILYRQPEHYTQFQNIPKRYLNTTIHTLPENYTIEHTHREKRCRATSLKEEEVDTFRCLDCGKEYKHPNCLTKHQWEHTEQWEYASKFLLTKHQQVQMLEAASILMNMKKK